MSTAGRIVNHAHCIQCGRAIQFGETICSEECAEERAEGQKARKKMMYFTYGLLVVGFLLLVIGPALMGQ